MRYQKVMNKYAYVVDKNFTHIYLGINETPKSNYGDFWIIKLSECIYVPNTLVISASRNGEEVKQYFCVPSGNLAAYNLLDDIEKKIESREQIKRLWKDYKTLITKLKYSNSWQKYNDEIVSIAKNFLFKYNKINVINFRLAKITDTRRCKKYKREKKVGKDNLQFDTTIFIKGSYYQVGCDMK